MEIEYDLSNDLSVDDLNKEIDRIWGDPEFQTELRNCKEKAGLTLNQLGEREKLITFERRGSGFDPATTAIIVYFAPVAAKALRDIWDVVILPRIKQRLGKDSLRSK